MLSDRPPKARWPRMQRFMLSPRGREAELQYRETIMASRAQEGRASFDSARAAWAQAHQVQPDDGLYLAELREASRNMQEMVAALETCGKTRVDAINALGRLVDAGLIATAA